MGPSNSVDIEPSKWLNFLNNLSDETVNSDIHTLDEQQEQQNSPYHIPVLENLKISIETDSKYSVFDTNINPPSNLPAEEDNQEPNVTIKNSQNNNNDVSQNNQIIVSNTHDSSVSSRQTTEIRSEEIFNIHINLENSARKVCEWIYTTLSLKPKNNQKIEKLSDAISDFHNWNSQFEEVQKKEERKSFYNMSYKDKIKDLGKGEILALDVSKSLRLYNIQKTVLSIFAGATGLLVALANSNQIKNVLKLNMKKQTIITVLKLSEKLYLPAIFSLLGGVAMACIYNRYVYNGYCKEAEKLNQMIEETVEHHPKHIYEDLRKK